jgi:hypothetical protein
MAKVTVTWLEHKVAELNDWLKNHHDLHHLTPQKKQKRDYYVWKLTEMDEYDLQTIEI